MLRVASRMQIGLGVTRQDGRRLGYLFNIGSGAISWQSKRQNIVALSTCEAELMGPDASNQGSHLAEKTPPRAEHGPGIKRNDHLRGQPRGHRSVLEPTIPLSHKAYGNPTQVAGRGPRQRNSGAQIYPNHRTNC